MVWRGFNIATFHSPTGLFYSGWHNLSSHLLTYWTGRRGSRVEPVAVPASQPLVLYEYNGCPFCQRVRAVISELDLDVHVFPTPRVTVKAYAKAEGSRYRPEVKAKSGQLMFPYLEDPNSGVRMSDSGAIIGYLLETYARGAEARAFSSLPISRLMIRSLRLSLYFGVLRVPSRLPEKPLVFYGAQGHAHSVMVFDALSCLELPYLWKSCAVGSRKVPEMKGLAGRSAQLCLQDPNTEFVSGSPVAIIRYLYKSYQVGNIPDETVRDYSTDGAGSQHGTLSSKAE